MNLSRATISALFFALIAFNAVSAVVMGIDFGSSTYKAVLVQNKFRIVLNEQSGRKTSSSISFRQGVRAFSSGADNAARFQPDISFNYLRDLLGKESLEQQSVKDLKKYIFYGDRLVQSKAKAPNGTEIDFNFISVKLDDGNTLGVHEMIAMILEQCRMMVEKDAGTKVPDAAITVPVYFTQRERQALIEAAELAGINVLSLINEPTAYALQHALDFASSFTEPKNVLLVDLGESALQLSLFKYEQVAGKDKKNVTQVTNLATGWDTNLGGREFDRSIVAHFASQLLKKGGDIYSNKRAHYRMLAQMHKSKEVLSANKETEFSLDGLVYDIDFKGKITRQEFEALNSHLFAGVAARIETLLKAANVTKTEVDYVELIGGSARVPKLQDELKIFFGRESLDYHINGDEAGVFGAAYFAASLSSQHRVKEIKLKDASPWRVGVAVKELDNAAIPSEEEKLERNTVLFRDGNRYSSKKTISFNSARDFQMEMFYNVSAEDAAPLPVGTDPLLDRFEFHGVPTKEVYNLTEVPKVHVGFRLTPAGTIDLVEQKAEIQVSETVKTLKKKEIPAVEAKEAAPEEEKEGEVEEPVEAASEETEGKAEEKTEEAEKKPEEKPEEAEKKADEEKPAETVEEYVMEEKIVTKTIPLRVTKSPRTSLPFNLRKTTIKLMGEYNEKDRIRVQTEMAKNDLEAYIILSKDKIEDSTFIEFSTESDREKISELSSDSRDWLESDGENAGMSAYVDKKNNLVNLVSPVLFRIKEVQARQDSLLYCDKIFNYTRTYLPVLSITHNVTEEEVSATLQQADDLEKWIMEKLADQAKLELFKDPLVTADQIKAKCELTQTAATKLLRRPKKKLPPVVNKTVINETTSEQKDPEQEEQQQEEQQEDKAEQETQNEQQEEQVPPKSDL